METQNPLPFTHMMSLMVKLYLMLVIGLATFSGGMALYVGSPNDFICLVPAAVLCVALPVFYQGLLTVDAQMMNPFGNDEIDFPLRVYQNRMANECRAFYKCAAHAPTGFHQLPPQRLKWQVNSDFITASPTPRMAGSPEPETPRSATGARLSGASSEQDRWAALSFDSLRDPYAARAADEARGGDSSAELASRAASKVGLHSRRGTPGAVLTPRSPFAAPGSPTSALPSIRGAGLRA